MAGRTSGRKAYRLDSVIGVRVQELPDAVPGMYGFTAHLQGRYPAFALLQGPLPVPANGDVYVVQLLSPFDYQILAYIDRYGRVFETNEPFQVPPACYPSLAFARYAEQETPEEEHGCVQLYNAQGETTYPARYVAHGRMYKLCGSWYKFDAYDFRMTLDEALARAYLALVYRPKYLRLPEPPRGQSLVEQALKEERPLAALSRIDGEVSRATADPALEPPAFLQCFSYWLQQAGIDQAVRMAGPGLGVHMEYPTPHAQLFRFSGDEDCPLSDCQLWKLENACNRYELVRRAMEGNLDQPSLAPYALADDALRRNVCQLAADAAHPLDGATTTASNEWSVRTNIARAIESFALPFTFQAEFRANLAQGRVFFDALVPDSDMMPAWVWDTATDNWKLLSEDERGAAALHYAQGVGVLLAAAAFHESRRISEVSVTAYVLSDGNQEVHEAVYQVRFDRERFCQDGAYRELRDASVEAFFQRFSENAGQTSVREIDSALLSRSAAATQPRSIEVPGLVQELPAEQLESNVHHPDAFDVVLALPTGGQKSKLGGPVRRTMGPRAQQALGCEDAHDLTVNFDADRRMVAEGVADKLVKAQSAAEGIRLVRECQEQSNDPSVLEACNRVMAQLAEGQLDMSDQNQVVNSFLGKDRFMEALLAARAAEEQDRPDEAAQILCRVLEETLLAGTYADSPTVVHRVFESTASRVLYNLLRNGQVQVEGVDLSAERDARVELAPDSLLFCLIDAVRLLERTFDRMDDALRYGRIACRIAPTMAAGYRQLARAYMLMGDLESARKLLLSALQLTLQPHDIGTAYYQLAYVEWKMGRHRPAVAAYCKAMIEAPAIRLQAVAELRELFREKRMRMLEPQQINPALVRAGIPLAPSEKLLDLMHSAAEATVNEGIFPAAQNVLSTELHYRPDDVLYHVLHSLD